MGTAAGDVLNFSIVAGGTAAAAKKNRQQYQQREQHQQQQEEEREEQNSFADWLDFFVIPRDDVAVTASTSNNNVEEREEQQQQQQEPSRMLLWPSLYGTFGVVFILVKAIKRVLPVALEPLLVRSSVPAAKAGILKTNFFLHQNAVLPPSPPPLTSLQLGMYVVTCLFFAYFEGCRGFQKKFSPLVVKRSFTLVPTADADAASADGSRKGSSSSPWWHLVLAPLYSMGLFHATPKRTMISRCVTLGVAALVIAVKKLPYPYRNIVDAGVVAGLTWGSLSISVLYVKAWIRKEHPPGVSAELPPPPSAAPAAAATTTTTT